METELVLETLSGKDLKTIDSVQNNDGSYGYTL